MKQIAQNYKSGELALLEVPVPAVRPGGVLVRTRVLAHLHRHRDDEDQREQAVVDRQGAGPARPGQEGHAVGVPAGPARHLPEGQRPARLLHAARLLALRRGRRGGRRRGGARRRAAGRLRRQQLRPPRRVQLGPTQPLRAPARGGRRRARRLHHRRRHCHAGLPAVGGAAGGDRLRHRTRPGRAAAGADPAGRRGERGRARPVGRAMPAGGAGRRRRLPPTRPGQPRPGAGDARRPHRRRRGRPHLPRRRRRHQPAGRARRRAGPRPGPGRRHRQMPPRPAMDRVLRQRAGRPVLALVRPRTLRPDLRGGRGRLPDRLCPLDRAAQHGLLPGPGGRGPARPRPPRLRRAAVRRRGRHLRADPARRARRCRHAVPLPGQRVAAVGGWPPPPRPAAEPASRPPPCRWSGSA